MVNSDPGDKMKHSADKIKNQDASTWIFVGVIVAYTFFALVVIAGLSS